jgi:hypothetical protein
MRIANKNASGYISQRIDFEGSNIFSKNLTTEINGNQDNNGNNIYREKLNSYIVYSYGYHFPMFIYINNKWFENSDKYSRTTSKQQAQSNPGNIYKKISLKDMMILADSFVNRDDYERIVKND